MSWRRIFRQHRLLTVFILLITIIYCLASAFWFVENRVANSIMLIAQVKADFIATKAVNEAVLSELKNSDIEYSDLINIHQDDEGRITMAEINTFDINRILSNVTINAQTYLNDLSREEFSIPLGEVSGNYLLSTYGPKIPVHIYPAGKISTHINDVFESAGINQTRHKIYLEINAAMYIAIPLINSELKVNTTVPLVDAVYQGDVPDTVFNLNLDDIPFAVPSQEQPGVNY